MLAISKPCLRSSVFLARYATSSFAGLPDLELFSSQKDGRMRINRFSADYFVVNGVEVRSSIILLPHTGYLWRPQNFAQVTSDSFTIFRLLQPKLDTLIIGGGRSAPHLSKELYQEIASICQGFELLKTHDACSLFNVLNEEGRQVGAALIRAEL